MTFDSFVNSVVIFGAGGHAKVVADIIMKNGKFKIAAFIDDHKQNQSLWTVPIISEMSYFSDPKTSSGIVALGDNFIREKVVKNIRQKISNFTFISAIHPSAQLGKDVKVGEGTVIMANSVINPSTQLGSHCIVNTMASIDHDCVIEDFASVAPNACLGGNCQVGRSSAISIGATLVHRVAVGQNTVIGAAALAIRNVPENCVYFGTPARFIRSRKSGDKYL